MAQTQSGSKLSAPKGTHDILPAQWQLRDHIESVARRHLQSAGYGRISTPTFEHTEVFARGVGEGTDIVGKEMYTFDDRGGRSLTLRPEGTAGVARAFVQHGLAREPMPLKLWYLQPMFRYERPQAGRMREHWQLGCECFGVPGPMAEAELISLLSGLYRELGLQDVTLHLNTIGSGEARATYREALVAYLSRYKDELDDDSKDRLSTNPLRILDSKAPRTRQILTDAPLLSDHLTTEDAAAFDELQALLDSLSIAVRLDPLLVRGLDYYTGTVFEFKATGGGLGAQDTVGAGGRYDGLIHQFGGGDVSGVGFGCGIERLLLALDQSAASEPAIDVFVGADPDAGLDARLSAASLAQALRFMPAPDASRPLIVELDLLGRSPKRQAKNCNSPVRVLAGADGLRLFVRGGSWDGELLTDQALAPAAIAKAVPSLNTQN